MQLWKWSISGLLQPQLDVLSSLISFFLFCCFFFFHITVLHFFFVIKPIKVPWMERIEIIFMRWRQHRGWFAFCSSLNHITVYLQFYLFSAGRPPLGQMPFIVTPEGKYLAQSGAIMRYICKKGGKIWLIIFYKQTLCRIWSRACISYVWYGAWTKKAWEKRL